MNCEFKAKDAQFNVIKIYEIHIERILSLIMEKIKYYSELGFEELTYFIDYSITDKIFKKDNILYYQDLTDSLKELKFDVYSIDNTKIIISWKIENTEPLESIEPPLKRICRMERN